jgi:hypothetical protein
MGASTMPLNRERPLRRLCWRKACVGSGDKRMMDVGLMPAGSLFVDDGGCP